MWDIQRVRSADTGEPLDRAQLPLPRAMSGEVVEHSHMIVQRPSDGRDLYISESAVPLLGASGEIEGALAVFTDVTSEHQRNLALEQERERIAMDLHDGIIQSLYGVVLSLGATRRHATGEEADSLSQAIEQINDVIGELRSYIYNLRPVAAEPVDLCAELKSMVRDLAGRSSLQLDVEVPKELACALPASISNEVLHICREALSNVVRHAQAKKASIIMARTNASALTLSIADDGVGFERLATGRRRGDGLRNMSLRAESMGGRLVINSTTGRGTTLHVEVPVPSCP